MAAPNMNGRLHLADAHQNSPASFGIKSIYVLPKNMISPGGFLEITIYATYWFEGQGVILEQEVCSKTPISPIKLKVIETVAVIMQNA